MHQRAKHRDAKLRMCGALWTSTVTGQKLHRGLIPTILSSEDCGAHDAMRLRWIRSGKLAVGLTCRPQMGARRFSKTLLSQGGKGGKNGEGAMAKGISSESWEVWLCEEA